MEGSYAIGYAINFYQDNYKTYKFSCSTVLIMDTKVILKINPDDLTNPSKYTTGQLRTIVDKSRRERDILGHHDGCDVHPSNGGCTC
jgi:hypothetical protein